MNRQVARMACWVSLLCVSASLGPRLLAQEIAPTTTRAAQTTAPRSDNSATDNAAKQMHIVLLADDKDHGPAGNGLHDYPLWQKRWTVLLETMLPETMLPETMLPETMLPETMLPETILLGGKKDADEEQVPLVGPSQDTESTGGAPDVHVKTAWDWPSDAQFQAADVIVAYCYLDWTEDRIAQVRRYLQEGGGLVLIHSATWTKPEPSPNVASVMGVGGFRKYRHGPVRLDIVASKHPICTGLPKTIVLDDDETYWPPTPKLDRVTVLATSLEEQGAQGSTPKVAQPMLWCYEMGQGRVFGCVPGHRVKTFDDPMFRTLLLRGIAWAAGESPCRLDALAKTKTDAGQ